jgi:hypothetical protein
MSAIDNKDMAEAMEFDGVLPETLVILVEAQFRAGFVKPGLRPPHEPPLPRQPCREGQEHEREQHFHGRGSRSTAPPASDCLSTWARSS